MDFNKTCISCLKQKSVTEFYRHDGMADGYNGRCKECQKINTRMNYRKNRKQRVEYERKREQDPRRKEQKREYQKRLREKYPEKYKARTAVANALRDGRLIKEKCSFCGSRKSQAHHEDYSKPIEVIWFCRPCHTRHHGMVPF